MGPTWGQIESNVDPFELKWAPLDPVESIYTQSGPNWLPNCLNMDTSWTHSKLIMVPRLICQSTTTININNRFLLPRGGLTVTITSPFRLSSRLWQKRSHCHCRKQCSRPPRALWRHGAKGFGLPRSGKDQCDQRETSIPLDGWPETAVRPKMMVVGLLPWTGGLK